MACKIVEIQSKIDKKTGVVLENNPNALKEGDCAIVVMQPIKPMCLEVFKDFPPLGRFAIRDINLIVGAGIVKSI